MRNIESGIATLISVVLISLSGSEALASQKTARKGTSTIAQNGGQPRTAHRRVGMTDNGSRGKALQDEMQHENQMKEPTSVEIPNLRRKRRGADANRRSGTTGSAIDKDLNQRDMLHGSANEVALAEGRKKSATSTGRRSSFIPEVGDEVLLRERGQPRKQPPTPRRPHRM